MASLSAHRRFSLKNAALCMNGRNAKAATQHLEEGWTSALVQVSRTHCATFE
jgi:hypothetical protein